MYASVYTRMHEIYRYMKYYIYTKCTIHTCSASTSSASLPLNIRARATRRGTDARKSPAQNYAYTTNTVSYGDSCAYGNTHTKPYPHLGLARHRRRSFGWLCVWNERDAEAKREGTSRNGMGWLCVRFRNYHNCTTTIGSEGETYYSLSNERGLSSRRWIHNSSLCINNSLVFSYWTFLFESFQSIHLLATVRKCVFFLYLWDNISGILTISW